MSTSKQPATRVIHAGEGQDPNATPLTAPIYQTTTFLFPSFAKSLRKHSLGYSMDDAGALPPSLVRFLESGAWERRFGLARVG